MHSVTIAFVKLSLAFLFFASLATAVYFFNIDQSLRGIMIAVLFVLGIPINILLCIDASRLIRDEPYLSKSVQIVGVILGVPQVCLGSTLMAIGMIYPFYGLRNILINSSADRSSTLDVVWVLISLLMLILGYLYVKESLRLVRYKPKRKRR